MQTIRCIVTCRRSVVRTGMALIFNAFENMEVVGREESDLLEEAFLLQPDLVMYGLCRVQEDDCQALEKLEDEYQALEKLKELCRWTKVIVFSPDPLAGEEIAGLAGVSDGYIQVPLLPRLLHWAVELACSTGCFLYLGFIQSMKPGQEEMH